MEMNNSVFYKINSSSSCFADIKLKRASSKYTNLKTRESSYFSMSNRKKLFPVSSAFTTKYYMVIMLINQLLHESQYYIFHGRYLHILVNWIYA